MAEETETTETRRGRARQGQGEPHGDLVALIEGALADLPATDAEIEVAKRYGGTGEFKSRMLGAREKLLQIRAKLIGSTAQ